MKRKIFSAVLTFSVLLLVSGLFGCSDDDAKFKYLTCQEFKEAADECRERENDHESCLIEKMCDISGGSKKSEETKECFDHYREECDWNGI
jgi:hypothetical protein